MEKTKPKIKIDSDKLVRINIIRTNDNRIMVDIKSLLNDYLLIVLKL